MQANCQCGALSATITQGAEPLTVLCHCTDCQQRSGSPFGVMAYFPKDAVSISGEATQFTRVSEAGNNYTTGFCPDCGSTLFSLPGKHPHLVGITLGTITQGEIPQPAFSVYEQDQYKWVSLPEDMPGFDRGRPS